MPIEIKNNFAKGLDLDTAYYLLPNSAYVHGLNICRDAIAESQDHIISNIISNRLVAYDYPTTGIVIGSYANTLRNTVIFFRYSATGFSGIYQYSKTTNQITKIFESITDSGGEDILNFTVAGKITGINIYNRDEGDLLFFLDSLGRPTLMNITRFVSGEYTPVTRSIIDVALMWPSIPPDCVYGNDTTRRTNNLRNREFRFQYIWVTDENQETCCSPVSAVAIPVNILEPTYTNVVTNNNVLTLSLQSGGKNVKEIKILMSYAEKTNSWTDFAVVDTISKEDDSINDDVAFTYSFYNDGTYPTYELARRLQLFDYIPKLAKAQEMPSGNYLAYGALTEGVNRVIDPSVTITINTVAAGGGGAIGSLSGVVSTLVGNARRIAFSGVPAVGTQVVVRVLVGGVTNTIAGTYTTIAGDTTTQVAIGMDVSMTSLGVVQTPIASGSNIDFVLAIGDTFGSLTITPPTVSADDNSIATWKWSTERDMAIAYYDEHGVTNGILYHAKIQFPRYQENGSLQVLLPYINVKIFHRPPDWAYTYQILFSKEGTQYLFFEITEVEQDTQFIYFNISNLAINQRQNPTTAQVINWSYLDSDRMRLIRRMADNNVFDDTYDAAVLGIITSPIINGVTHTDETFIKINKVAPFTTVNYASNLFVVELYRPGQPLANNENKVYYECGVQYPILNPTESDRVHGGQVTNQSDDLVTPAEINIYNGDSYFRSRTIYISDTGYGTFNVQDRNMVDFYLSAVSSIDGRALVEDTSQTETYFGAVIRHSGPYEPNTNINKLNQFPATNILECDYGFGDIGRLIVRDRLMKVFQTNKVGRTFIFGELGKDRSGNEILLNTDFLLNPIQYYIGDYGIGTAYSSIASKNYADYFCDNIRGAIIRASNDGLEVLSVLYKVNSWATSTLPGRTIYGGFDQRTNNYIVAVGATGNDGLKSFGYFNCANNTQIGFVAAGGSSDVCAREGKIFSAAGLPIELIHDYDCGSATCLRYRVSYPLLEAETITFSEDDNTFESFLSLAPENMCTLGTLLIAFKDGDVWTHNDTTYNNFFGEQYESSITAVFNQNPLEKKSWISLSQAGTKLWDCPEIETQAMSYGDTPQESELIDTDFERQENMWNSSFLRDSNSIGGLLNGDSLKGTYIKIKFRNDNASTLTTLNLVSVKFIDSPLTAT